MDHVQQLRDEISVLRETSAEHPKDVFKLQEEVDEVSQSLKYLLADVTSHRERSEKSVREIHEEVAELKVNSGATLSVDETRQAIEALQFDVVELRKVVSSDGIELQETRSELEKLDGEVVQLRTRRNLQHEDLQRGGHDGTILQLTREVRQDMEAERVSEQKLLGRIDELCERLMAVDSVVAKQSSAFLEASTSRRAGGSYGTEESSSYH